MATFSPYDEFDAVALARSTDKALKVLLPWCQLPNSSELPFVEDIAALALSCVKAIDFSVVGARNGFAIVEEAIILGDLNRNSTTDQHQSHSARMLVLAKDFRKNVAEMLQRFRDVHNDILDLLQNVEPEHERVEFECSIHVNGRNGIGDLEEFANNMNNFSTWWNRMKMDASSQETRTQVIQSNYNSLRQESVIRKWRKLEGQYADYAGEIGRIQECYPTLFVRSMNAIQTGERDRREQEQRDQQKKGGRGRQEQEQREREQEPDKGGRREGEKESERNRDSEGKGMQESTGLDDNLARLGDEPETLQLEGGVIANLENRLPRGHEREPSSDLSPGFFHNSNELVVDDCVFNDVEGNQISSTGLDDNLARLVDEPETLHLESANLEKRLRRLEREIENVASSDLSPGFFHNSKDPVVNDGVFNGVQGNQMNTNSVGENCNINSPSIHVSTISPNACFAQAAVVLAANADRFPLSVFRWNEIERKPYPIYEMASLSAPFSALALLYYIYALKHARHAV